MNPAEKRKHYRFDSLNLSYLCLDQEGNIVKQGMGRTLNISESGILLETYFPIDADHQILLSIGLKDEVVDVSGRLIHSRAGDKGRFEIGIEFVDLQEAARRTIQGFIRSIAVEDDDQPA